MKALVITSSREVVESISPSFQLRWPQATLSCVVDGSDAIEAVEAEWPDIVILDLDLPSMDGFDVLEKICLFSNVPLIVLTSSDEEMDKARALELGADGYITKPLSCVEFLARVEALLRRTRMAQLKEGCLMRTWQGTWRTNLINPLFSYSLN